MNIKTLVWSRVPLSRWFVSLVLLFTTTLLPVYADYSLDWRVVAPGGGDCANVRFSLSCTIAQPVAGPMGDQPYSLYAGFWSLFASNSATPAKPGILISQNALVDTGDFQYDGQDLVVSNCTLTVNGPHAFNSLRVINSGVVTHSAAPNGEPNHQLDLAIGADLTVDASSRIDATAKGYANDQGPGKGPPYGGGAYGGAGGSAGYGGGTSYGSTTNPVDVGSGGGGGGAGGGALHLVVGGTLLVNGSLVADGANATSGTYGYGGGGSGGSINLQAAALTGSGSIQANGGNSGTPANGAGGGGGGRIAISYTASTFVGSCQAFGGTGYKQGGAGTICLKKASESWHRLLVNNNSTVPGATTSISGIGQVPDLTIADGASVIVAGLTNVPGDLVVTNSSAVFPVLSSVGGGILVSNSTLSCGGSLEIGGDLIVGGPGARAELSGTILIHRDVAVLDGAALTHAPGGTGGVLLDVGGNLRVDAGSWIDVSGKGYANDQGSGKGPPYGGAGYGGGGGSAGYGGGLSYGSISDPADLGSGGGGGGAGGGAVRLVVAGFLQVDGSLVADGGNATSGTYGYGGGGSGGSINFLAGTLRGSGLIQANGGNSGTPANGGGGGGGGRIAGRFSVSTFTGAFHAFAGNGYQRGGAGTIYLKNASEAWPHLSVNNNSPVSAVSTPISGVGQLPSLTVEGGANAVFSGLTNVLDNLVVIGGSATFTDLRNVGGNLCVTSGAVSFTSSLELTGALAVSGPGAQAELNGTNFLHQGIELLGGAVLTHTAGKANGVLLNLGANLTIDAASRIDATGKGYARWAGPGKGGWAGDGGSGGGYGGPGGSGLSISGGITYGSATDPVDSGSGGGGGGDNTLGTGGGAIRLAVGGILQVDGSILANGVRAEGGVYGWAGGGSGGSINLRASVLKGVGLIAANGGDSGTAVNGSGGGGGGRIAIYTSNRPFTGQFLANGGVGQHSGGAGTIHFGDLLGKSLTAAIAASQNIELEWPSDLGATLESTLSLGDSSSWSAVSVSQYRTNNGVVSFVELPTVSRAKFYRLKKP